MNKNTNLSCRKITEIYFKAKIKGLYKTPLGRTSNGLIQNFVHQNKAFQFINNYSGFQVFLNVSIIRILFKQTFR